MITRSGRSVLGYVDAEGKRFSIRSHDSISALVEELDLSALPNGDDSYPEHWLEEEHISRASEEWMHHERGGVGSTTMDVAVLYTASVASRYDVTALISQAVADMNVSFSNTGVTAWVRVVHYGLSSYIEPALMDDNDYYHIPQQMRSGLASFPEVPDLRNTHGADLVVLIVDGSKATHVCGASLPLGSNHPVPSLQAFSVVADNCTGPERVFAHEIGHNFGVRHDGSGSSYIVHATAFGYTSVSPSFRTIMGSSNGCSLSSCSRINYWSNLNDVMNPMGDLTNNAYPHLTASSNNIIEQVATYRSSASGSIPGPFTSFSVAPQSCYGLNDLTYSGATGSIGWVEIQASSSSTFSSPYQVFSGHNSGTLQLNVPAMRYVRVRACMSNGCSAWKNGGQPATYFAGCM